jgi:hypothetical protein
MVRIIIGFNISEAYPSSSTRSSSTNSIAPTLQIRRLSFSIDLQDAGQIASEA